MKSSSNFNLDFIDALDELEQLSIQGIKNSEQVQTKDQFKDMHLTSFFSKQMAEECIFHNS